MALDPITADVIRHRFDAATDEMLVTLVKTAFSPNVKERRDCSAESGTDNDRIEIERIARHVPRPPAARISDCAIVA